jgi:VanZ family protein
MIVVLGLLPTQQAATAAAPGRELPLTVMGHYLGYFVFAILLAVAPAGRRACRRSVIGAFAVAVMLGAALEVAQAFLPYRDCQATDMLVNAIGAASGLIVLSSVSRLRRE